MTSVALVVVKARCYDIAEFAEVRSAKIFSLKARFRDGDGRRQQPHKTLVNSGSGALDGAQRATSVGR